MKDLCIIKKGLGIEKKAFLTEQVSAIIQSKNPVKYKDPGSPTISVNIGGTSIDKALLDLGASVNILPYSVYKQLGLGELKPTNITLSLAERSVKIPKGIVEDVLVKVDKFYYPVDFVVLDTEPIENELNHVPIIQGRPFLATANTIINCRNGVMQLTFGNMTLELNIFHGIANQGEAGVWVLPSVATAKQLVSPNSTILKKINNEESSIKAAAQTTVEVEELLLLDPP